jgi:ABC-2 type transport system permease protein
MKAFRTMLKIELKLSLRGMDMFIFAICMPIVVLVILGVIFGSKPAYDGAAYTFLEQSFGGVASLSVCAGGVMGLPLVISDYRHKRILKRLKVTPTSPAMILAVQLAIYTIYCLISLLLLFLTSKLFFGYQLRGSLPGFLGSYLLVIVSIFSIGMMVGGIAPDTKSAGIIASILYFPMLIFSGGTLPYEIMPPMLQRLANVMPLTQGIKLLKATSLGLPIEGVLFAIIITCILAVVCSGIAIKFFKWE